MKTFENAFKVVVALTLAAMVIGCYVDQSTKPKEPKKEVTEEKTIIEKHSDDGHTH